MLTSFSVGCARLPVYSHGRTSSSGQLGFAGRPLAALDALAEGSSVTWLYGCSLKAGRSAVGFGKR